jgi:tripartite-type tricarboxylate transporter receptor subunit TctC
MTIFGHTDAVRRRFIETLGLTTVGAFSPSQSEERWPSRPVRLIVPTAAGGAGDLWARAFAGEFSKACGQPVIVDNKVGAGGLIAATAVALSPADGYTLLAAFSSFLTNEVIRTKLPYKVGDVIPVAGVMAAPSCILVDARLNVRDLSDLQVYAKARPEVFFAAAGIGSTSHFAGELVKSALGIPMTFVHYRSGSECLVSVLSGQTQCLAEVPSPGVIAHVKKGDLRAIAIAGDGRLGHVPGVRTAIEQGFPDIRMTSWFGVFIRQGPPTPVFPRMQALIQQVVSSSELETFAAQQRVQFLGGETSLHS